MSAEPMKGNSIIVRTAAAALSTVKRCFAWLFSIRVLKRFKIIADIAAVIVVPVGGWIIYNRYEATVNERAYQTQLAASLVNLDNQTGVLDRQIALLSSLGTPGMQLLLTMLAECDPADQGAAYDPRAAVPSSSGMKVTGPSGNNHADDALRVNSQKFKQISFALYGDGSEERLKVIQQAIRDHPDPRVRRACLRTFEILPQLKMIPFLKQVMYDDSQDAEVRTVAFLAHFTCLEAFRQPRNYSGLRLRGDNLLYSRVFDYITLKNSLFWGVNLRFTQWHNCSLKNVKFITNDMMNSDWRSIQNMDGRQRQRREDREPLVSQLQNVKFIIRGSMTYTRFSGTVLTGVDFIGDGNGQSGNISFIQASLKHVTFADLNLDNVSFMGATLEDVKFYNCNLTNLNFDDKSVLDKVSFKSGSLGVNFSGAKWGRVVVCTRLRSIDREGLKNGGHLAVCRPCADALIQKLGGGLEGLVIEEY